MSYNDNRQKPKYRSWQQNRAKKHGCEIKIGMLGFLGSCSTKMKTRECVRDCYHILNDHANELFGQEFSSKPNETTENECADVDLELNSELESLKEKNCVPPTQRRFQNVDTGVPGLIFISTTVPDPVKLVHKIASSLAESKIQKSKWLQRLVPVEIVCKAAMEEISKATDILIRKYFESGDKRFSILFSHTHNDSLDRVKIVETLAGQVMAVNSTNSVDLSTPNLCLSVSVIKSICCLAVLPDYFTLKKYNMLELSTSKDSVEQDQPAEELTGNDDDVPNDN